MTQPVYVAGVGMTAFGRNLEATLKHLTADSVQAAIGDASVEPGQIEAAFFANAIGGSITGQEMVAGQVALRAIELEPIPIYNIENACASASSAFQLGMQAIASGIHDIVLAVGAEKMSHRNKARSFAAIGGAADVEEVFGPNGPGTSDRSYFMDLYAGLALDHMSRYGSTVEDFALVAVKNQRHGAANSRAQYGGETTVEDVLSAREVVSPLTVPMCSPISDGAAAAVLVSERIADQLDRAGVRVAASVVTSGSRGGAEDNAVQLASRKAFEKAGIGPAELDIVELHDATASAEVKLYEDIGLASPGDGAALIREDCTTYGGDVVVNPSGGLLAKGHPIGATGIAQIVEAVEQLRGIAGDRQVPGACWALTQNAGGWIETDNAAVAVTLLEGPR
jgi:acetyl-CoA acetyltransferase